MNIKGKNGAWSYTHAAIEKHHNGSFTMFATIEPYDIPFKKTFYDYPIAEARRIFKNDLQIETDRYLVGITEE